MTSFATETKNNLLCILYSRECCQSAKLCGLDLTPPVLLCTECGGAYFAGVFISHGTMTDPQKDYRLELVFADSAAADLVADIMQSRGFAPKRTARGNSYILYISDSTAVEDFLVYMGATSASMSIMNAKIFRDIRNTQNRRANCDTANIFKATATAQTHIRAINTLIAAGKIDSLPPELRDTASLRVQYPEASLAELAAMHSPPITKSGLNHRLRRIVNVDL